MKTATPTKPAATKVGTPTIEKSNAKAPHRHECWATGDVAHQGDVIFVALKTLPKSAKPRENRQLADGETKGSRHILVGGKCFTADKAEIRKALERYAKLEVADAYIGPVFSGAATVEHPEHAHQVFPDHACTAVVYQRNLDSEEREQRARD